MTAIISDKFRIFNAKQFYESLSEGASDTDDVRSRMYFFVGRSQPWNTYVEFYNRSTANFSVGETVTAAGGFSATVITVYPNVLLLNASPSSNVTNGATITGGTSGATAKVGLYRYGTEDVPLAPVDNEKEKNLIYDEMISAKRINSSNARHVTRRFNWDKVINPKFDMWRGDYSSLNRSATDQTNIADTKHYVLNVSNYEVFLCVYNGTNVSNPSGQNATYPPTRTPVSGEGTYDGSTGLFTEPSGTYVWKYLYTISTDDVIKFLSSDFMPVSPDSAVQAAAVDGRIDAVYIKDAGTNLPANLTNKYAAIIGDGTGGKVRFSTNGSGQLSALSIESRGSGYTYASVILKNGYVYNEAALSTLVTTGWGANPVGEIQVIIPPQGGYGFDTISNLNAKRIMMNVRLTYAEGDGDFPVDNDFRRIGVVQDPLKFGTSSYLTEDTATNLFSVKLTTVTGSFVKDDVISQTVSGVTAKGTIVSFTYDEGSTTSGVLKYYQSPLEHTVNGKVNPFLSNGANAITASLGGSGFVDTTYGNVGSSTAWASGAAVTNNSFVTHTWTSNGITYNVTYQVVGTGNLGTTQPNHTSGTATNGAVDLKVYEPLVGQLYTNGLANPEIKPNSGEIIYVENRRLISRSPDQIEDIKLVIEF